GETVEFTDIFVVHHGSIQTPAQRKRKLQRDFRILQLDLQEQPDHPFILFNLGMTCDDAGMYSEAIDYLKRCLHVSGPDESHVRKAWSILVNSQRLAGEIEEAIEHARSGLDLYPDDPELRFRYGVLLLHVDQCEAAVQEFRRILTRTSIRRFQSVDSSITGYKLHHNLALALDRLGKTREAAAEWDQAFSHAPASATAQLEVARHALQLGNHEKLREVALRASENDDPCHTACVAAMVSVSEGDPEQAESLLRTAWNESDDDVCLDELARLMLEGGWPERAVGPLCELAELRPDCGATSFNLAQALLSVGQQEVGREMLERSLRLRPHHQAAMRLLHSLTDVAVANGDRPSDNQHPSSESESP
ncbi:MAG: tetratricopeptide repeat protein, partial [Planctomycetaceae bacterium]|nr:tetratricopeptide repeat protein [Planctomycetaceae bacterium]